MVKKVDFVIPLGNGDPEVDAPISSILERTCKNIKEQTLPVNLTFAIDRNLNNNKRAIIEKYADKIRVFDTDSSYFSKGGIWLKIYTCWEESSYPYVCWSGYDDFSSLDRFEKQVHVMESGDYNSCFCHSHMSHDGVGGGLVTDSRCIDFNSTLGSHAQFMGAWLLKKDSIVNSGISQYKLKWAYYFEGLLNSFIIKCGKIGRSDGQFFYHEHRGTISRTVTEAKAWVQNHRRITGYSLSETESDWNSINFGKINEDIRRGLT